MKPIYVYNSFLCRLISLWMPIDGICLYPFIFFRNDNISIETKVHEQIHFSQQKELYVIGFYFLYLYEYARLRFVFKKKHEQAYRRISFEMEAYTYQYDINYLQYRARHHWRKFTL